MAFLPLEPPAHTYVQAVAWMRKPPWTYRHNLCTCQTSYHLGPGETPANRNMLSKANMLRNPCIFEGYASYMMSLAQQRRISREFELHGRFYAVDSTTINLCMSLFQWAHFRITKSRVKVHPQIDIVTEIPVFYRITNAKVHDTKFMDCFTYEPLTCYVFYHGYFDLARLFSMHLCVDFFIIHKTGKPEYESLSKSELLDGADDVLLDQVIRLTSRRNLNNYPLELRRIVYYADDLGHSFIYHTNNFYLSAKNIAQLYHYRWQVELFFKWIKQHLRVKSFWGEAENAVRIQIHVAIITYCLVAIIEHDIKLRRPVFEVMRILGSSMLVKDNLKELFEHRQDETVENCQLELNFLR